MPLGSLYSMTVKDSPSRLALEPLVLGPPNAIEIELMVVLPGDTVNSLSARRVPPPLLLMARAFSAVPSSCSKRESWRSGWHLPAQRLQGRRRQSDGVDGQRTGPMREGWTRAHRGLSARLGGQRTRWCLAELACGGQAERWQEGAGGIPR